MARKRVKYPFHFNERYYHYARQIIRGLYDIPRTNWADKHVLNPETVGEHTGDLVIMAKKLYPQKNGIAKMLEIHDWAKYQVEDLRTDPSRTTKKQKYEDELAVMKEICSHLGKDGKAVLSYWLEFKEGKTERARIAKQLNKLQLILKAIEYQKQGTMVMAQEFINHDGDKIKEPQLRKILEEAMAEIS